MVISKMTQLAWLKHGLLEIHMRMAWSHKKSQPGTLNDHGLECFLFPKNSRLRSL